MATIATTRLGKLEGQEAGGVLVFRGVPYAAPPVGDLRFRAPEPARAWSGVREAREPGPSAPQPLIMMRDIPEQDEDCLYLTVWTPGLDAGRRPVMVFIHGGGFFSGASTHSMYDGRELARRGDVVVVSFNYRLGVLGFADLGALGNASFAACANHGLYDQLAALVWVRENIEAFGGDPGEVTLFGQSAGAMSVATLMTLPASRGLFRRAIAQSGAAHHVALRTESAKVTQRLLDVLGIAPHEIERLRQLPHQAFLSAHEVCASVAVTLGGGQHVLRETMMAFGPVVDGELIPELPLAATERGAGAEIPLLLGTNADEYNFWAFLANPEVRDLDESTLIRLVEQRLPGHGTRVWDAYRTLHGDTQRLEPWRVFSAIETDRMFTMPAIRLAEARSQSSTFLYGFDWTGPMFDKQLGAFHAMELPFVFGLVDEGFGQVFAGGGSAARLLSELMMNAWLAFVRSSDPSTPALGAWPRYDAKRERMRLARSHGLESAMRVELQELWSNLV